MFEYFQHSHHPQVTIWDFDLNHPQPQPVSAFQDMGWQMAVRHLNTAKLYFGGDIAKSVAEDNAKRYRAHATGIRENVEGIHHSP